MGDDDTARLVGDLIAITVRVDELVKKDSSLTALQRDCLINAIGNLNTFFAIWKRSHISPQDSMSEPGKTDA